MNIANRSYAVLDLPTPPENRLFVANIGSLVSEADLGGIFKAFGAVEECVLMVRRYRVLT